MSSSRSRLDLNRASSFLLKFASHDFMTRLLTLLIKTKISLSVRPNKNNFGNFVSPHTHILILFLLMLLLRLTS